MRFSHSEMGHQSIQVLGMSDFGVTGNWIFRLSVPAAVVAEKKVPLLESLDLLCPELVRVTFSVDEDDRKAGSFHAVGQANAVYVDESQVFGITGRPAVLGGLRSILGGGFHRRNEYR